jgi:replicative DNA helicase
MDSSQNHSESQDIKIPQAPDAELAILGALLLNGAIPESVRQRLKPSQFFVRSNRKMYEAELALDARGVALDPVQLCEELRKAGEIDEIGGYAYVSTLTDRAIRGDLDGHVALVIDAAEKRHLWTACMEGARAANNGHTPAEIRKILREAVGNAGEEPKDAKIDDLVVSWADFDAEQFPQGERIAFAAERGEIALLNALPNAGKTTLALIIALCLAIGRRFLPLVTEEKQRRVLYIDGETRRARLQRDLRTMTKDFSRKEAMAVGQNLQIICEAEILGESLALTRTDHLLQLSNDALRVKPDFIVIDTLASLCPVFNENDNAEQTRKVWRPLQKLARDCDAAILVLHHVGKRNEDSQTPERVYGGRGASASGGAARAV